MRDKFYESVKTLSSNIKDIDREVAKKKDFINASLQKIAGVLSKPVNDKFNSTKSDINQEAYGQLNKTLELIRSSLDDWQETQQERLNQEKFRDEFKDSFLVIIYGKVKAGKSSLGNFIADQGKTYGLVPEFFKYDKAGNQSVVPKLEELEEGSFYVDNCEATNGIQGFKLAGLTWIDTPGLDTMNQENAALALKYIDAADYILFPMSSDAPGRATDLRHIYELTQNKDKRLDVIITKSDKTEEDELDGAIIKILKNKTKENRSTQESYTKETILKEVRISIDPYSISVYAATKGLAEKAVDLYEGSQLELFYEKMTEIILNEAVELKANQPIKSLRAFANQSLIGNVENPKQHTLIAIIKNLDETFDSRKKVLDTLEEANTKTEAELVQQIELIINENYSKIKKYNDTKIIQEIVDKLQIKLKDRAKQNIENSMGSFNSALAKLEISINMDDFKIKDKTKSGKRKNTETVRSYGKIVGGATAGLLAGAALTQFWNPIGWAAGSILLVSAIATGVAATAGSAVGGKIGEQFASEKEEEVRVGDTKDEVISSLKSEFGKLCRIQLNEMKDALDNYYLMPISDFASGLRSELIYIQKSIEEGLK